MFHMKKASSLMLGLSVVFAITGCSTVSSSGPKKSSILKLANPDNPSRAQVVDVNETIADQLQRFEKRTLFSETLSGGAYSGVIGVGDLLQVSIWEAPPAVLLGGSLGALGSGHAQTVQLPVQMVDKNGVIQIPFAGSIKVKGKLTSEVQADIVHRLKDMANQPQVLVNTVQNNSAAVTIIREGKSVTLPLTPKGERVLDAVSAIGGVPYAADKTTLQLTRGKTVRSLPLIQITQDPRQNIFLQSGDVITSTLQPYSFTALGASGKAGEINFESQGISLAKALGRVGGLQDNLADASGVFIFRYENPEILNLAENTPAANANHKIPVVYRINLKDADAMFYTQNFPMRDQDVMFVANAPISDLQKFLKVVSALTSPIYETTRAVNLINATANALAND